jgi:hypothetical protein
VPAASIVRVAPPAVEPIPSVGMASSKEMEEFFAAIVHGELEVVAKLLRTCGVNARQTPLAAFWNQQKVSDGPTALMLAMRHGHNNVAELLLNQKADPLLKDQFNKRAPMYALEYGHGEMPSVKSLISTLPAGEDKHTDDWGHNLMMCADRRAARWPVHAQRRSGTGAVDAARRWALRGGGRCGGGQAHVRRGAS